MKELDQIRTKLESIERAVYLGAKQILDVEEAAAFIGYSPKGLYQLTYKKEIPHYKQHGKLYFRKSELEAWMTQTRVATTFEIGRQAESYVYLHKR